MDSNLAEKCVCVLICSSMFSHNCYMYMYLDYLKSYLLCHSKCDDDTEARNDSTATFVLQPTFGTQYETTRVVFHTLCTRRIIQL